MRNPLHENLKSWFAIREGHLPITKISEDGEWYTLSSGDIQYLLEVANKYLDDDNFQSNYPFSEHRFGYHLGLWLNRYISEGLTGEMLHELRGMLQNIRFYHVLTPAIPSRGKPLPYWEFHVDMQEFSGSEMEAAYALAHQLTFDGFAGLKRCKRKECRRFFMRRRDAKWCSDKCSSHDRVRKMRKTLKMKN